MDYDYERTLAVGNGFMAIGISERFSVAEETEFSEKTRFRGIGFHPKEVSHEQN